MTKQIKKRSAKAGLPAGALVHVGEKKSKKVRITVIEYNEDDFEEKEVKSVDECCPSKNESVIRWINVEGLHEVEVLQKIGNLCGMHALVLEDILNTEKRPKIDDFGDYIFVVLKMIYLNEEDSSVEAEQVSLIFGTNFVISFQEREGDVFDPVRERIREKDSRIRKMKADYLAYSLIDAIVDGYFSCLEELGEKIESLEEKLVTSAASETLEEVHSLKREMIFVRRSVWPLREVVAWLERAESNLIERETFIYLKDVYDHTVELIDVVETYREMLSGMLDIYLSSLSNRMNEVMKVLTIIATIFIPLTLISGIYGMNFKHMPELKWPWGYPAVLVVMVVIGVVMLIYFRKKRWI